jgi:uncharacterized protein (TIGR04255 family)
VVTPYPKPPLVEAIFELFVAGDGMDWSTEAAGLLEGVLARQFDGPRETILPAGLQIQLSPEGVVSQSMQPEPARRRLWTSDRGELFQFSSGMCAYNLLEHYRSFEQHAGTVESLARVYLEHRRPKAIAWVGQRYVNRIVVPVDAGDPATFFEIYPKVPVGQHRPFAMQILSGEFQGGQVMLNLVYQGEQDRMATYVLDIYARSSVELEPESGGIRRWHEAAHVLVRRSFEDALTAKTKALFQGAGNR